MANRWGEKWKQWETLFSWAPKSQQIVIAAMKLKDVCFLKEKLWPTCDSILKSRDITLSTKVYLVKAMVFPVVMYGYEGWTIKKAERQRIDAFEWWCWRKPLRVPWTTRRSNQLILKEINPEYSLEGLMLKLKLQCFGHLMWRTWLIGKDPDVGKDWRQEEKGTTGDETIGWHHRLDGHEFEQAVGVGDGQGGLACCSSWGHRESETTEQLNWNLISKCSIMVVSWEAWWLIHGGPFEIIALFRIANYQM